MRNIYFYKTIEKAKAKAKELKKKGSRVVMSKESTPYKADDGRLFYYSAMWIFWYIKQKKNLKKIKILFDKDGELGYYIIKIKGIRRKKKNGKQRIQKSS